MKTYEIATIVEGFTVRAINKELRGRLCLRGKPFTTRILDYRGEPKEVTPAVFNDIGERGIALLFNNGTVLVALCSHPHDMIAMWRTMEAVRHFDLIRLPLIDDVYLALTRLPEDEDDRKKKEKSVKRLVAKIGRDRYDEIMSLPVPEQILRAILGHQKYGLAPDLVTIFNEVKAGNLEWREAFAAAGIKHPDALAAETKERAEKLAPFETLLAAHAKSQKMSREANQMYHIENALLTLIEKGAVGKQLTGVIFVVAVVKGVFTNIHLRMNMALSGMLNEEDRNKEFAAFITENILLAAKAISTKWNKLPSLQSPQISISESEATKLIIDLLNEYFPTKTEGAPA